MSPLISFKKSSPPPGSLVHVGERKTTRVSMSVTDYDQETIETIGCDKVEQLLAHKDSKINSWIRVSGLHNIKGMEDIGEHFDIDELLLEDILDTEQRPKCEVSQKQLFITLKAVGISATDNQIHAEQVSIILGRGWLISFQEEESNLFKSIMRQLQDSESELRERGLDFLLYRLLDVIVDNYVRVIRHLSDGLDELEEQILRSIEDEQLMEIQDYRKEIMDLRRMMAATKDAMSNLQKDGGRWVVKDTLPFLRDVSDHLSKISDTLESQREMASGIRDLYNTGMSNRMNQIMKVLTIVSTIFIPLTFIVGVYGMNFEHMPELKTGAGYYVVWGVMALIALAMIIFFRSRKWL